MAVQSPTHFPAGDIVVLDRGEGTRVIVHLHGATILSWVCKGEEQLFLRCIYDIPKLKSLRITQFMHPEITENVIECILKLQKISKAVFDNKKAIRGGIPIVFPNFGPWSLGPQHGFARIKRWSAAILPTPDKNRDIVAVFQLEDDEDTRKMWNHKFKLVYTLTLGETSLLSNMVVHNTGSSKFDFTCLLHTYFRVPDICCTNINGLQGLTYVDKLRDSKEFKEDREVVTITDNNDRVYKDNSKPVVVQSAANRSVELTTFNLQDIVLWNPWVQKAKEMSDFDDDGWRYMVCVEAGVVSSPVEVAGGHHFESSQTFRVVQE